MNAKIVLTLMSFAVAVNAHAAEPSDPNQSSKYLNAVRTFADNVVKYGRDTYGPKHTPLFVDGLNIHTHEPAKWISSNLEHVQCRTSCELYPDSVAKRNDPRCLPEE